MISIGILTYNAPTTLAYTLDTYKRNGLFNICTDINVWIQQSQNAKHEQDICNTYNLPFTQAEDNLWIGSGFRGLANKAKEDYILLLENDFTLIYDEDHTRSTLHTAVDMLNDKTADAVLLRSRWNSGFPNWALLNKQYPKMIMKEGFDGDTHLCDCRYWYKHPDLVFPDKIKKIKENPDWYQSTSRYCNFTNNPTMYRTQFYREHVLPFCVDKTDVEHHCSRWWWKQQFKCVFGDGIFKHIRIDGDRAY